MTENKIDRKNVEEMMGLTSMQEGMLFHYLTNPESLQYFEQIHLTLSGSIERQLFEEAWRLVTCNNEMLRSIIRWEKLEEPIQIVLKQKEIPIRVVEFKDEDQQSKAEGVQKIIKKDRETPININRDPFRVTLCLISENESRMLLSFHHIVLDGWSTGIILQEFLTAYNCLSQGETQSEITKARYKDFFKWYQQSQTHYRDQRREFWKKHLEGFDTLTLLPYNDNKLQDIQQVSTYRLNVPATTKQRLEVLAQEHNVTISTLLYAAWGILLQKYNNSDDVIFGTTVSGRSPEVKGIDRIVGLFINTLPLRIKATKETPLYKLFQILGNHLQEQNAYGNEHSSLTEIKQLSGLSSDSNLFDSIIVIDNYPLDNMINEKYSSNQLEISGYQTFEMTNFDITLQIMMLEAGEMPVDIHYNNELFETETIQRMANHYDIILRGIVSNPAQKIADVPILSEHETRQILEEFNNPSIQWVVDKTIHGVISSIFNEAIEQELINANPASALLKTILPPLSKRDLKRADPLTQEELSHFMAHAQRIGSWAELLILKMMAYAGLRLGEALAMRREYLDTKNRTYFVCQSFNRRQFNRPKHGKRRLIDLPDFLVDELEAYIGHLKKERLRTGSGGKINLLFIDPAEKRPLPYSQRKIQYLMKKVSKAAGLRIRNPHDLRHSYATLVLMSHMSPGYVQKQLGHSSISITMDIYCHRIPTKGRQGLEAAFGEGAVVPDRGEKPHIIAYQKKRVSVSH